MRIVCKQELSTENPVIIAMMKRIGVTSMSVSLFYVDDRIWYVFLDNSLISFSLHVATHPFYLGLFIHNPAMGGGWSNLN